MCGGDGKRDCSTLDDGQVAVDVSDGEVEADREFVGLDHALYHAIHSVAVGIGLSIVGELADDEGFELWHNSA